MRLELNQIKTRHICAHQHLKRAPSYDRYGSYGMCILYVYYACGPAGSMVKQQFKILLKVFFLVTCVNDDLYTISQKFC